MPADPTRDEELNICAQCGQSMPLGESVRFQDGQGFHVVCPTTALEASAPLPPSPPELRPAA